MHYRREIDGLRAFAVLPVIFFHAGFESFGGGFVGIDIFFVISGYLIASVILKEQRSGKFSLLRFYERRVRRILPALFLILVSCIPFAWFWMLPNELENFGQSLTATSLFYSNFFFWSDSGYFSAPVELKPLLHTWSLAVEEQYYLLFPLFMVLAGRLDKRLTVLILTLVAGVSLAGAQWGSNYNPIANYYLLPTRGWELLAGVIAAFYLGNKEPDFQILDRLWGECLSILGVILIIYSISIFNEDTRFPGFWALLPTTGTVLIILFAIPGTWVGAVLSLKPIVGIGLISYSLYLWHQPMFAFARGRILGEISSATYCVLIVAAFGLAFLSWRFVETPFRDSRILSRRFILIFGVAGSVALATMGLVANLNDGFKGRFDLAKYELDGFVIPKIDNGYCFYSVDDMPELPVGEDGLECGLGKLLSSRKGLLLGDSFAGQYEPFWDIVARDIDANVNSITTNWCIPTSNSDFTGVRGGRAFEQCLLNRQFALANLAAFDFVILGADWGHVLARDMMSGVLELIAMASEETGIVILMPSPRQFDTSPSDLYRKSIIFDSRFDLSKIPTQDDISAVRANDVLSDIAQRYANVFYLERDVIFSRHGVPSDLTIESVPYSLDGDHISVLGSRNAGEYFLRTATYNELRSRMLSDD